MKHFTAAAVAAAIFILIQTLPAQAQHVVDGYFTGPSEWDPSRSTVTTQLYSPAPDGSGNSQLYAEHVYPPIPSDPNSFDMLYMMADYTGSSPGATKSNTTFNWFFQESALYCQGDFLITLGPNGLSEYTQNYYDQVKLNPDGSFYTGADSGWGPLDPDDLADGNIQGAVGFGASPTDSNHHLMAEVGIAIYEPAEGYYRQGIISPNPPTFFSFSTVNSSDPVVAAGYITLNPDGTTSDDQVDPDNSNLSANAPNGDLSLLPPGQQGAIVGVPEAGGLAMFACCGLAVCVFGWSSFQRRKGATRMYQ